MQYRPVLTLVSDPTPLSLSILEKLLAHLCQVEVVTKKIDRWREISAHITQTNSFDVVSQQKEQTPDYLIISDAELSLKAQEYQSSINIHKRSSPKTILVLPFCTNSADELSKFERVKQFVLPHTEEFGTIYVGDTLGPRIETSGGGAMYELFSEVIKKNKYSLNKGGAFYYPLSFSDAAAQIIKSLFSFGPYGESMAILGPRIPQEELFQKAKKFVPSAETRYGDREIRQEASCEKKQTIQSNLDLLVKESLEWLRSEKSVPPPKSKELIEKEPQEREVITPRPTKEIKTFSWKGISRVFSALLFMLALPFLLLAVSGLALFVSTERIKKTDLSSASIALPVSYATARGASGIFTLYSKTPLLGDLFIPAQEASELIARTSEVLERGKGIVEKASALVFLSMGKEPYDVNGLSQEVALELDWLYKEAGFLVGETQALGGGLSYLADKYIPINEIENAREKILQAKSVFLHLPSLLGNQEPTTYLVLFQNNMELRPTGGFIGSYALASFDKGRLTDLSVSDVYSADGQLKGHVEPPMPIKDYLGEASWYLRDSNWDPDFPVSASRAEWFLEKEIDKSVDGVIGLDLEFAKELLRVVGPVSLADFNESVDESNLYEKTQSEVEEDFFPGSYKKTNFLTSLSRELITKLTQSPKESYLSIAKAIVKSLEERHIQIFSHNRTVQNALSYLGYEGGVNQPVCFDNCYSDWVGVVDANLGVNKANYFIKRSGELSVYLSEFGIKRYLTIRLENSANPALGLAGRYKSYLRAMVPQSAQVNDVEISSQTEKIAVSPDVSQVSARKEVGVLVEVLPQETKEVLFSWEEPNPLSFSEPGEYRLYIRKQAGTAADAITINVFIPEEIQPTFIPEYSLTQAGGYVYNTYLTRDFFSRIIW